MHSLGSVGCLPLCSFWMHDLLSNVLVKGEWGRVLQDRVGELIKETDFLGLLEKRKNGLTREVRNSKETDKITTHAHTQVSRLAL